MLIYNIKDNSWGNVIKWLEDLGFRCFHTCEPNFVYSILFIDINNHAFSLYNYYQMQFDETEMMFLVVNNYVSHYIRAIRQNCKNMPASRDALISDLVSIALEV